MIRKQKVKKTGETKVTFVISGDHQHAGKVSVVGDFNDWNGTLGKALENQLGMREVFRDEHGHYAKTFPSHYPILRMDRIYYRGIDLIESECLGRRPWSELSDHLPLYARFDLGQSPALLPS